MNISSSRLKLAVGAIAREIRDRTVGTEMPVGDDGLLREFCSCILGSQVRYEVALSATESVVDGGVLRRGVSYAEVACSVEETLRRPIYVDGRRTAYRFPRAKALQLASAWQVVCGLGSVRTVLDSVASPVLLREWLTTNISGIGPKQASMLLRNCGRSYDLAVIDRHVVTYMSMVGLSPPTPSSLSRLAVYAECESTLREHALEFDCPLGVLDWAIWVVVRAARAPNALSGVTQ